MTEGQAQPEAGGGTNGRGRQEMKSTNALHAPHATRERTETRESIRQPGRKGHTRPPAVERKKTCSDSERTITAY